STATVQVGRPDLTTSAVSDPPAAAVPNAVFQVTDTVVNPTAFPAGATRTQYYLSVDGLKNAGDRLLSGARAVPALPAGTPSTGTVTVAIPGSTLPGTYYLLACADDAGAVPETDETNNCRASANRIQVGRPDLVTTEVSAVRVGTSTSISVADTVQNASAFPVTGTLRVQYDLPLDGLKRGGDRLL